MRERLITTELRWGQEQIKLVWEGWSRVAPVNGSAVLWARKSLNKSERDQVFLNMWDWAPSQILVFTKTAGRMTWLRSLLSKVFFGLLNTSNILSTSLRPILARCLLSHEKRSRKIGSRNHTRYQTFLFCSFLIVFCYFFPCGVLWSRLVKSISFHIPEDLKRYYLGFG